ncbi:hypothetical protein [Leifsonia sp. 22587]|uniref:hypothetical protein n=1 Tax=Leifsonia sp. 22587 TaxID=3453946 RepID=UPI003F83BB59
MTNRNQNFEGGTNGATLTTSNAGGSGNTQFSSVVIPAGTTIVFDNAFASQGSQCINMTNTGTSTVNARWTGISSTAFAASVYVYLTTAPTADLFLFNAASGGTTVMRATITISGGAAKLSMLDTRGTTTRVWTAASAFPLNQWVRIEVYCTINAGAATYNAAYYLGDNSTAVDSTAVTNANTGSAAIDTFILGKTDSSAYTSPIRFDGVQTNDAATGYIGRWPATAATSVRPNSVVSNGGTFSNQGGAGSLSAAVADESDTTYIQSGDNPTGGSIVYGFALLSSGDVTVKTRDQMSLSSPATKTLVELLQLPSNTVISSRTWNLTTSWVDNSWTTDPATETPNITDRSNLALRITDYLG